jgi:diguanylate cyclase (GGDEF)-like protein
MLLLDRAMLPDIFNLAVALRLGLFTSVNMVAIWLLARNPAPWLRESIIGGLGVLGAGIIGLLVAASTSPGREYYLFGIMFLALFVIAAQRIRFRFAVPTAVAMLSIHALSALAIIELNMAAVIALMALTQATVLFVLYSLYALEQQERQIWLRSLRDRLRASLFEELAALDPLTGLGNRRAMQQWVAARYGEAPTKVSLIIADIDCFKSYNDTFGHLAGDDCIRRIGAMFVAEARGRHDGVFRFGGEEFIVVLVGSGDEVARSIAERMRRAVSAARIPHNSPMGLDHVTVSFGVATVDSPIELDLTALIAEADAKLYEAKRKGRNQVVPPLIRIASVVNG